MARSNKYAAINFNEIYGPKRPSPSSSSHSTPHSSISSSQNTPIPTPRPHGRMLVLTRPSKPHPQPPPPTSKAADPPLSELDSISLRPLGRTDSSSSPSSTVHIINEEKQSPPLTSSHKPEAFVPPHLRPGFVGREERLGQDSQREKQGFRTRERSQVFVQGHVREYSSPPRQSGREDGRPRSGGYEGMRQRESGSDLERSRPSSGGNRPSSSGWNGSSSRSRQF